MPQEDRHRMFEWSNRMVGNEDPEYQDQTELAMTSAMELYAYASELFAKKRIDPHADLMSALTTVEIEGERLSDMELELFFLLLTVAGNETTRNLMSGAMHAFFQNPEQWQRLLDDRSLLPSAVDEMLRFVTPVMNFRRTAMVDTELSGTKIAAGDKVVFFHASANRDEDIFTDPDTFDVGRDPNPHIAFGGGGPALLPRDQSGPDGDPGHVRAPARPDARHSPEWRGAAPPVPVHQWRQAHSRGVLAFLPRRLLSRPAPEGRATRWHGARPTR